MNLIATQIGLAQKVRPQGAIRASWEAFLSEQLERDDAIRFAEEDRPLSSFEVQGVEKKVGIIKKIAGLLAV